MSGPGTTAVHGGAPEGAGEGPLSPPLVRASTWRFASLDDLTRASGDPDRGFYARYGGPDFARVEARHAALHGAERSLFFASGMAALSALLLGLCRSGGRVVAQREVYGGTKRLLGELARRWGLDVRFVDARDPAALAAALPGASLCLVESPSNPLLSVLDLRAVGMRCREAGVLLAVDATFQGPSDLLPLLLGADLVMESATKSLGGHSDLLAGFVAGGARVLDAVETARRVFGGVAAPDVAWLLERSLKTLPLRTARQAQTALHLAGRLEADPRVLDVRHPGLSSHPDAPLLRTLAEACGRPGGVGLVAFRVRGGPAAARAALERLRLIANAPSLGGVETLASLPALTSHAALSPEERAAAGIRDDHVRLSVGVEDPEDLWADLDRALGR